MQATVKSVIESSALRDYYQRVRSDTENLCEPLEIEDYIPQPVVDVSPPKWNIAHTTWFFEEMILKKYNPDYTVFDPQFGFLFNSYYNTIGDRTQRDHRGISRPTVEQVFAYREYVDEQMSKMLADEVSDEIRSLVILGLNHEQQHQELLLTDLKYTFSVNPLFPAYKKDFAPEEKSEPPAVAGGWLDVKGGLYDIGHHGDGFCFDNELSRHKVYLNDFAISERLVTNSEFIEFIESGGYKDFRFWHSEGWDWLSQNHIASPLYWHKCENGWKQFTLGGLRDLSLKAPVCHISFYEAAAFAEWKGLRLPTEFEWEVANSQFDWGKRWEWTGSAYLPYPGFIKAVGAIGEYNGKFMVNQMVLRGASAITPDGHSRPTYRNFFHPHLRWQFTGIRLAR